MDLEIIEQRVGSELLSITCSFYISQQGLKCFISFLFPSQKEGRLFTPDRRGLPTHTWFELKDDATLTHSAPEVSCHAKPYFHTTVFFLHSEAVRGSAL